MSICEAEVVKDLDFNATSLWSALKVDTLYTYELFFTKALYINRD